MKSQRFRIGEELCHIFMAVAPISHMNIGTVEVILKPPIINRNPIYVIQFYLLKVFQCAVFIIGIGGPSGETHPFLKGDFLGFLGEGLVILYKVGNLI